MTTKNEDRQLVFLRRLVKTLGIVLVVGVIFVFTMAIVRLTSKAKSVGDISKCSAAAQDIMLAQEGEIIAMNQENDLLTLAMKQGQEQKVIFIDICSGKLLRTLHLN